MPTTSLANSVADRVPSSVPLEVIRDRGTLSPMQAIVVWLTEERGVDDQRAAQLLNCDPAEIRMHRSRARRKQG